MTPTLKTEVSLASLVREMAGAAAARATDSTDVAVLGKAGLDMLYTPAWDALHTLGRNLDDEVASIARKCEATARDLDRHVKAILHDGGANIGESNPFATSYVTEVMASHVRAAAWRRIFRDQFKIVTGCPLEDALAGHRAPPPVKAAPPVLGPPLTGRRARR